LTRDCDATQAAARRHTSAAAAKAWPVRDPQHLISTGDSSASSDLHDALAGNVAAEAVGADVASSGYMEGEAPAGSLGVPGARLLLATAVSVGKGTYKFKVGCCEPAAAAAASAAVEFCWATSVSLRTGCRAARVQATSLRCSPGMNWHGYQVAATI
jgi:hypothetical protein